MFNKPQPFVKWAGGKRSLLSEIKLLFPEQFNCYYESFVGGGAVYFAFEDKIKRAILSDNNFDLTVTYKIIKEEPLSLVRKLKEYASKHSEKHYYSIREKKPTVDIDIAARFLYLNKTCYNGLYRVNKSGKFNVPIGKYKNPNIVQKENILACHEALKKAKILHKDFKKIKPKKRDFIYLDPPYNPVDETSFVSYTKEKFTEKDQIQLAELIKKLDSQGVYVMLSNSKTKLIERLYPKKHFKHHIVRAPRFVNSKGDKRGAVEELLITNY
ncbi:MAG: Dam family site-specific DNA-(adenine-N6)-methyltransferase [Candidatus Melainabacteria bacterium]|nr:Dam family site-specific DNA-(adenine-N6)-methyltransferase [Candidatus Melainabacteria bacterium]